MTQTTPPLPRRSRIRRFFSFIMFRFVPVLLILGTVWTGAQVIAAFSRQYNAYNDINARHDAYSGTATAIATANDTDVQSNSLFPADDSGLVMVQFSTNTPEGGSTSPEVVISPTSSDILNSTTATPTPIPSPAPPTSSNPTPVIIPTIIPPLAQPPVAQLDGTAVPTQVPLIPREHVLVNIMILGGDDEVTEDSTVRTDTMIIVSINTETHTVSMFSLPRDLWVYMPTNNPAMTRLNTVFGIGRVNGWADNGWDLLRQTIFYNFGINVHYYAKINFTGFETIIDTVGGVEVANDCAYEDYYPIAPIEQLDLSRPQEENYKLRTLPVGYYMMDGFDALWFARTRRSTTDFDRNHRQQAIIKAVFRKALQSGQIAQLPQLWGEFTQVVETNVPFETMLGLVPIAVSLNPDSVESFTLVRTYHTTPWQPPSGAFAGQAVQLPNYQPIHDLLVDFYTPPTENQINSTKPPIAVYNGTANPDWDKVAAGRLREDGYNAYAAGPADRTDYADSMLIDEAALDKDSLTGKIADILNIGGGNITTQANPARTADYRVIVGASYNSCDAEGMGA
jgi:LCP family protein required for cell wall assembly